MPRYGSISRALVSTAARACDRRGRRWPQAAYGGSATDACPSAWQYPRSASRKRCSGRRRVSAGLRPIELLGHAPHRCERVAGMSSSKTVIQARTRTPSDVTEISVSSTSISRSGKLGAMRTSECDGGRARAAGPHDIVLDVPHSFRRSSDGGCAPVMRPARDDGRYHDLNPRLRQDSGCQTDPLACAVANLIQLPSLLPVAAACSCRPLRPNWNAQGSRLQAGTAEMEKRRLALVGARR